MVLKYFIRENGEGAYCEGEDTDYLYTQGNIKEVPKKPSSAYKWDNTGNQWVIDSSKTPPNTYSDWDGNLWVANLTKKRAFINDLVNKELQRTAYFIIDSVLVAQDLIDLQAYRAALIALKNQPTADEAIIPVCPDAAKESLV